MRCAYPAYAFLPVQQRRRADKRQRIRQCDTGLINLRDDHVLRHRVTNVVGMAHARR